MALNLFKILQYSVYIFGGAVHVYIHTKHVTRYRFDEMSSKNEKKIDEKKSKRIYADIQKQKLYLERNVPKAKSKWQQQQQKETTIYKQHTHQIKITIFLFSE